MKINKLWIVILVILIVGCLTTSYTKRYRDQLMGATVVTTEQEAAPEAAAAAEGAAADSRMRKQADEAGALLKAVPETQAVLQAAPDGAVPDGARSGQAVSGQAAPGMSVQSASDLEVSGAAADSAMARAALPVPEAAGGERTNGYLNRLKDLDARLEQEQGTSADTTNSMKAAAEQERKLWETELNRILDALEELLPEEEMQALFKEQKEWMRERESIAVESSKKKSGSALEEVEYNVSLADTTRSRAYELAEQYASVLTGAE